MTAESEASHQLSQRRRFTAEEWVKPEVDPPKGSRCRALCVKILEIRRR